MSSAIKAAEDIKLIASRFRGFIEAADVLARIGSLEQAENDALVKKDAAYKAADTAIEFLKAKEKEIEDVKAQFEAVEEEAEKIKNTAKDHAVFILKDAKEKAALVVKEAGTKKLEIGQQIVELRKSFAQAQSELDSKKEELAAVIEQIASVKTKLQVLFK